MPRHDPRALAGRVVDDLDGRERAARGGEAKVRGILVAPAVSDKARKYLDDLGLEYRELDWDKLRGTAAAALRAGQRTLGSF